MKLIHLLNPTMSSNTTHQPHKPWWTQTVKYCGKTTQERIWGAAPQHIMEGQQMILKNRHSFTNRASNPRFQSCVSETHWPLMWITSWGPTRTNIPTIDNMMDMQCWEEICQGFLAMHPMCLFCGSKLRCNFPFSYDRGLGLCCSPLREPRFQKMTPSPDYHTLSILSYYPLGVLMVLSPPPPGNTPKFWIIIGTADW